MTNVKIIVYLKSSKIAKEASEAGVSEVNSSGR